MKSFFYSGVIPASKSHFNRALICASYSNDLVNLRGQSLCDDVVKMRTAIAKLGIEHTYDCGSAGTVLRFLALRVSRVPGRHILMGTPRLMSRPQEDLNDIFLQLGVKMDLHPDRLIIESDGWKLNKPVLNVNRDISSQFVSALVLNTWNLDHDMTIQWPQHGVSDGYWKMSLQVVKDFGMDIKMQTPLSVSIPANSKVNIREYTVESDMSSAFAIAAYAALNGEAHFHEFPLKTLQPDAVFIDILEAMGVQIKKDKNLVSVCQQTGTPMKGIHWNLNECPDLFPVLTTLCAFAKGPSRLDGAPHLVFKESNRIQKTAELLNRMGVNNQILSDGISLNPPPILPKVLDPFSYDTDHDHRLAFAAALLSSQNYPIRIQRPEVVNKSFPEFWQILMNGNKSL